MSSLSHKKEAQNTPPSLLIDASIYIFQYYFSLPDHWYSKKESWPTAAVYGYTAFLVRLLEQQVMSEPEQKRKRYIITR